jgi:hypothetical protein
MEKIDKIWIEIFAIGVMLNGVYILIKLDRIITLLEGMK